MYSLRQLVGKRATRDGIETVGQPIDEILREDKTKTNGVSRLGFISRHKGAHISFRSGLSDGEKQEALEAVTKLRADRDLPTAQVAIAVAELPPNLSEGQDVEGEDDV